MENQLLTLKNNELTVQINPKGAELTHVIDAENKFDFIWNGSEWPKHAPILFPAIGRSTDDEYLLDQKSYPMQQHGFASDYSFEIIEQKDDQLSLLFKDNEETYQSYPFHFEFKVTYQLVSKKLKIGEQMILITGGNGQLGTELRHLLDERGIAYTATDAKELDITDGVAVDKFFDENKPELVYHCAAYTAVDKAEDEGRELDEKINVDGTKNVAEAAARVGATLVYISTDYVFGGLLPIGQEWPVDAPKAPESEYGRTKHLGEEAVVASGVKYYIIRTAWVFGSYGPNFVFTMQNLATRFPELTVVNDQHGRPTWTRTLAEFMVYLVSEKADFGFYHLTNDAASGEDVTWFDFAKEILKDTDVLVKPVDSSKFPAKAKRPFNSTMSLEKAKATGFVIPTWQEALASMLEKGDLRENKDGVKGEINKK